MLYMTYYISRYMYVKFMFCLHFFVFAFRIGRSCPLRLVIGMKWRKNKIITISIYYKRFFGYWCYFVYVCLFQMYPQKMKLNIEQKNLLIKHSHEIYIYLQFFFNYLLASGLICIYVCMYVFIFNIRGTWM